METRQISSSERNTQVIAYTSLAITLLGILWNVFFGYGKLSGKIDAMQDDINEIKTSMIRFEDRMEKRFERLETRFDNLEAEFHKMDIRVTTLEQQRKP